MRKLYHEAKKKIRSLTRRHVEKMPTKRISVEEATRMTVERYGQVLRNLADK
ncbi:hypothetical protein HYS28_01530 [Candidatus Uhrbacteria bacterium]|nr:hypothetical protein [Candidatus Uhrbacteria bacterium]